MSKFEGGGSRRAVVVAGLLPLVGLLAACGGGGGAAGAVGTGAPLIVLVATPTNGQETLTDLSDPGLNNKLTVKFSDSPRLKDMLDSTNSYNGLTPNVQLLNQAFTRVSGQPSLDPATQSFTFAPAGGTLPAAQYTLTVSKFVASAAGNPLNLGTQDFSTSWTVGPDTYAPVIRNTSPAANQSEVPLFAPIVITFNESLDPATVVLGQTVFVQTGSNPPIVQNGVLSLQRDGFDLVFTPDPCSGLTPSTSIVVRLLAFAMTTPPPPAIPQLVNVTYIKDRVGNGFTGDPATLGETDLQFNTKGTKPLPNQAFVNIPGFPRSNIAGYTAFASTSNTTFGFDMGPVVADFLQNGTDRPELVVQILAANRTWKRVGANWVQQPPFGGDFEAKLGQAGEALTDWRPDPVTGHTYIYQVDAAKESIAIIHTGSGKIEGHFNGVGTPRGIAISASTGFTPTLFISNYGQGTVTALPIGNVIPGKPICTAVKELQDDPTKRLYLLTGRNPSGIACDYAGSPIAAVVNQADNDIQVFDPSTLKPVDTIGYGTLQQHYPVGENPIDVVWNPYINGLGIFCYIVNQGGIETPNGSISLWFNNSGFTNFSSQTGGIIGSVEDGMKTPGLPCLDPFSGINAYCYVPNTAGDDIARIQLKITGGLLWTVIVPSLGESRPVGEGPTKMTFTGPGILSLAFVALAGEGQVAVYDRAAPPGLPYKAPLPGVRYVFSAYDQ